MDKKYYRECRRFIHDDRDAEEIAADMQKRGMPDENVLQHIYDYLVKRWDPIPDWDNPALIKVIEALVNPTDPKVAGFEAAKTAYERLEYSEQDILKFKVIEGLSEKTIAQISTTPLNKIAEKATLAKRKFWKEFTRERWSTLTYFFQPLYEEADSSASSEILKVDAEYQAAKTAYDSLDERDRAILIQRHLEGLSVAEIAVKQRTSPVDISNILTTARDEFYDTLTSEIFRQTPIKIRANKDDINDAEDYIQDAWGELIERRYKFIPENLRAWLKKTASRSASGSVKKEKRRDEITEIYGRTYLNNDGESTHVASTDAEPLQPDEENEKEALEKKELRRLELARQQWSDLLKMTARGILETKKPEKKLYVFVHYILQPVLNQLWGGAKARRLDGFQDPGEALGIAHVLDQYQSNATQAEIGDVIDATDRSIRRYVDEILVLVKRYAKEVGIKNKELAAGLDGGKSGL